MTCRPFREDRTAFSRKSLKTFEEMKEELLRLAKVNKISFLNGENIHLPKKISKKTCALLAFFNNPMIKNVRMSSQESLDNFIYNDCELLTPKGMSFGDTNTSSLFLLLPIIAF